MGQTKHPFRIRKLTSGILEIRMQETTEGETYIFGLQSFQFLIDLSIEWLAHPDVKGILYHLDGQEGFDANEVRQLFEEAKDPGRFQELLKQCLHDSLRLQAQSKPLVAIIQGRISGLALAWAFLCHRRIACGPDTYTGFPEYKYGFFPGFGTTVRLAGILGIEKTVYVLGQGRFYSAEEGQQMGWIDGIAVNENQAWDISCKWINESKEETNRTYTIPPHDHMRDNEVISKMEKRSRGLIPAVLALTSILKDISTLSREQALTLEGQWYTEILNSPVTQRMVRTLCYGVHDAVASSRLTKENPFAVRKIGVLGAGMMGSGIAYEAALAGIKVILKDVSYAAAEKGKAYSKKITDRLQQQGQLSPKESTRLLSLVHPTENLQDLEGADMIIEAVFEDKELKKKLIRESVPFLKEQGFFASNTTSIPITDLASASVKPTAFIGMHFFSPVDRMPLVEIIRGHDTSDDTVNKAMHLAYQLGKVPIVVHDGPAFFTSRIFFNYILEGICMLLEGIPPNYVEDKALEAGFSIGPLAVLDEISLELMLHVYDQLPHLHPSQLRAYQYLKKLVDQGRNGRKTGAGFYSYPSDGGKKEIWQDPDLPTQNEMPSADDTKKRFLHVMALDSYRCLEEGILDKPIDGDIGSLLGVGYPSHTGGVFSHIDETGLKAFVHDCQRFIHFGEQWDMPISLLRLAETDFTFYADIVPMLRTKY